MDGGRYIEPTIHVFRQTLHGSADRAFDGRQVTEGPGADRLDGCYFDGAEDEGYSRFGVTGGWWIVDRYATPPLYLYSNIWVDDYVGMTRDLITFYRDSEKAPCKAYAQQLMKICTNGQGYPFTQQYRSHYITYSVDSTAVTAGRSGQHASRQWP